MSAPDVVDDDAVHGVDRLPGDAENAARAMDEIVADSDEDGGDTDEDVPDQPEDNYESDGDDQEWALGFCERAPAETLQRQFFPSKVGGRPAWLDPVDVPTAAQLKCLYTREPLDFLLQVYASVDDEPTAFHRAVFLFVSLSVCLSVSVFVSVFVFVFVFGVLLFVAICSTSPPGGNQVDGLPPV